MVSKKMERFYMVGSIPSGLHISLDWILLISIVRYRSLQKRNKELTEWRLRDFVVMLSVLSSAALRFDIQDHANLKQYIF